MTDLVQKISVLAIHYTELLAELQGDIEEIYLRLGDDGNDVDSCLLPFAKFISILNKLV